MSKTSKLLIVLLAVSCLAFVYHQDRNGIVALNNYEHAVVICGDETENESVDIQDVAHMRLWDGNTYTINWGHINDTEIRVLREYATNQCK